MAVVNLHPENAELEAFALGQLENATAVEAHLATCPTCQQKAAGTTADALVALLRHVHGQRAHPTDTVPPLAQGKVLTPVPAASETVTFPPAPPEERAGPEPEIAESGPKELVSHERYRVVRKLGEGGMGVVFEAEHRVLQRPVALKVINRAYTANAAAVGRFRREVRVAARLSHPNIVTTYDAEDTDSTHFLVMEYVEGVSLERLVKDRGPLPVAEAVAYVRQAALGLQHAHERGMIHRDVKPDNLMLVARPGASAPGVVKVLDFGLAALMAERGKGLTDTNVIMGTPDYMAPEQAEDARRADIRADVYSLGGTLYFLLTGRVPYPAPTPLLKILAHREQPLPSLAQPCPQAPVALDKVMARMLAKKPEDRYQTPGEVAAALEPFLADKAKGDKRPGSKLRWLAAAAVLFVGILMAGAVYRIQTDKGELVITTESDDVEVVIKQGGKEVRVVDTKTNKSITFRSGVYDLELKGAPEGLKLNIDKATLTRGETVLAKVERIGVEPEKSEPEPVRMLHRIRWGDGAHWSNVDVSSDGRYFLAGRPNGAVRVWDMKTGKQLHEFIPAYFGRFLPGGKVVTGPWDGKYRIYDVASGKKLGEFTDEATPPINFRVCGDGSRLVSSHAGKLLVWDVAGQRKLGEIPFANTENVPVWMSRDGKSFYYQAEWKPPLRAMDAVTGKELPLSPALRDLSKLAARLIHMTPDGSRLFFTDERHIIACDADTGKEIARIEDGRGGSAVSGDGRRLLARAPGSNEFNIWDVDAGKRIETVSLPKHMDTKVFVDYVFSRDGRYLALAGHLDWLHVYRLPDPSEEKRP